MSKGNILIVLTSHSKLGETSKNTGFHYEEMTTPYKVFKEAGYNVELTSISGGAPPHDPSSLKEKLDDNATSVCEFLSNENNKDKLANTKSITEIDAEDFDAIYLPGGHGTMWDFPNNKVLNNLVSKFYLGGKPVAAVCHGIAGFIGAKDENGNEIVKNQRINSFTDAEEKEIGLDKEVPFLLETKLKELGAKFECANNFQAYIAQNDNIVTGQNPASCEGVAEMLVTLLKK